ncbi:MAG: oxalate oxidoreductase subunit alpha [Thermodesulfobacteriota bacterium]
MGTKKFLTGLGATATAVKMADVDVITSFPIRPYTGVMMILSQMVANGELDAEFIHADGEHAQLSICHGASAAGARTFTGSSGVGVTYAFETYSPISGGRCPVQMLIADRTLDPPGDFGSEHTDALGCRDQGWIMGWAETPQEVFDNTLIYYRVGEDPRVRLPQFNCHDGYFVSHIPGEVEIPDQSQVDEFLPPYRPVDPLDPQKPVGHGPQIFPDQGPALEAMRHNAMMAAMPAIEEAIDDFGRIFGRKYAPFVEEFMTDDAELAFFINGAHAHTARYAIKHLRERGIKVGLVKIRFIRPWPTDLLQESLSRFKAVGVVETNSSFGIARGGGILAPEVCGSLYDVPQRPLIASFMGGLGGEPITLKEFDFIAGKLKKIAESGKIEKPVYWLGFEE